jgi:hypothetical protein
MKTHILRSFIIAIACSALAFAQSSTSKPKESDDPRGFTEIETFQGDINSSERLFKLDSAFGWDFNRHFGVFAGVPVYFVHVPSTTTTVGGVTTTTPASNNNGIGNIYLGFAFRAPNPTLAYASTITASAPTGDTKKGLSSGRATVDWDNRFEHEFARLTPFFEGGIGNTVPDSRLFTRPFTSLGFLTHLEEGAQYELLRHVGVGASAYQIVPAGNQKIFSKLVSRSGPNRGPGGSRQIFETSATASGTGLTRENGFNTFVSFEPNPIWQVELGYTRSITFDFNSFAFNIRMNVGKLLRSNRS